MFALSLMLVGATEETIVFCLFGSFPRFVKHKHVIILQLIFAVLWEHGVDSRISSFFYNTENLSVLEHFISVTVTCVLAHNNHSRIDII